MDLACGLLLADPWVKEALGVIEMCYSDFLQGNLSHGA